MSQQRLFTPQLIGQTEKTLNAILDRHLSGAGLSEPQWITLTLAVMAGEPIGRHELAQRVAGAAKFSEADVRTLIAELAEARLLDVADDDVTVTDSGKLLQARLRATNNALTERLWGDLPDADLETAGQSPGCDPRAGERRAGSGLATRRSTSNARASCPRAARRR
jgi:hypothetical protein